MKLTVLGKYGPYGKAGTGAASGYIIEEQGTKIVLDMGSGVLTRLQGATNIKDIDAVYISHLHYDHTSDLLPFRYLLEDIGCKVKIITRYDDGEWYKILFSHPNFDVINIDESSKISVGGLDLSFYKMKHTVTDYAVKISGEKTFVYTGDTMFTPKLYDAFEGADAALADCAKPVGFNGPHMTAADAIKLYNETGVRIIATHLSPDYAPYNEFQSIKGIEIAEEYKTYEI